MTENIRPNDDNFSSSFWAPIDAILSEFIPEITFFVLAEFLNDLLLVLEIRSF